MKDFNKYLKTKLLEGFTVKHGFFQQTHLDNIKEQNRYVLETDVPHLRGKQLIASQSSNLYPAKLSLKIKVRTKIFQACRYFKKSSPIYLLLVKCYKCAQ